MIDASQLCDNVKQGACNKKSNPLGQTKLLSNIKHRQKEESYKNSFKQEVHLSFTSIFSYLLKLLFFNLQQHNRFVYDIAKMDFSCATSDTEHFISRTWALELKVGLLLTVATLGHLD